jgi:hypothetical protein
MSEQEQQEATPAVAAGGEEQRQAVVDAAAPAAAASGGDDAAAAAHAKRGREEVEGADGEQPVAKRLAGDEEASAAGATNVRCWAVAMGEGRVLPAPLLAAKCCGPHVGVGGVLFLWLHRAWWLQLARDRQQLLERQQQSQQQQRQQERSSSAVALRTQEQPTQQPTAALAVTPRQTQWLLLGSMEQTLTTPQVREGRRHTTIRWGLDGAARMAVVGRLWTPAPAQRGGGMSACV